MHSGLSAHVPPFEKGGLGGISNASFDRAGFKSPPAPLLQRGERVSWRAWLGVLLLGLLPAFIGQSSAGPPLDDKGKAGYAEYLKAPGHRAFAIAPGGAWSWRGDMPSEDMARQGALEDCQAHARRRCQPYAVDERVVFDATDWSTAWRPYASAAQAAGAREGLAPGLRFPDIAYTDPAGKPRQLSSLTGKLVVLHFWGSWCPPCQREMPDLAKLHQALRGRPDVRFVFLPVREPVARSRAWMKDKGLALPVADGGATTEKEGAFRLADGRKLVDRDLARVFPTTYVLDRHGLILFAHTGPVADWGALTPLILDAAAHSGR